LLFPAISEGFRETGRRPGHLEYGIVMERWRIAEQSRRPNDPLNFKGKEAGSGIVRLVSTSKGR
jgi:hypothetical protein